MPTYSFICKKCQNKFSVTASFEEYDKKEPKIFKCPKCGSNKINQEIANVFFARGSRANKKIRCACEG